MEERKHSKVHSPKWIAVTLAGHPPSLLSRLGLTRMEERKHSKVQKPNGAPGSVAGLTTDTGMPGGETVNSMLERTRNGVRKGVRGFPARDGPGRHSTPRIVPADAAACWAYREPGKEDPTGVTATQTLD